MLEKALTGKRRYWAWVLFLLGIMGAGFVTYLWQLKQGLSITGMSRDVSWGFYISQFTYLVGVAASAVMLVIPYYLHHYKKFGKITILGEFVAVSAVTMCLLFIIVDLGQPQRAMNVILYPTPGSILFWDMLVLNGYLFINILVGWTALGAERKGIAPPLWIKPFIYLSIPWAISIHTVTAFLYAGLPGRHYWLTAILAARFLASAFCSGPAILVLLMLLVRKLTKFDAGKEALQSLTKIIAYAMFLNVFFVGLEVFTAFYSNIPGHMHSFEYLFHGDGVLVPFMWTSAVLGITSLALLIPSSTRNNVKILVPTLVMLIIATWIDKGLGLVAGGFIPNPLEHVTEYFPTGFEVMITLGIYATGALILTVLYKVATTVKEEAA
ncbi:MAG: polysulfide reductase NrfD [Deltaproteobacteria bacterium]|nr:polysulfide reductase NrfD [Deltaproteobacteria bacterium]